MFISSLPSKDSVKFTPGFTAPYVCPVKSLWLSQIQRAAILHHSRESCLRHVRLLLCQFFFFRSSNIGQIGLSRCANGSLCFSLYPNAAEEEDGDEAPEVQVSGKIGAKKQRKLEEKQARKAQREVSISCHV